MNPGLDQDYVPYRQAEMRREAAEARLASQARAVERVHPNEHGRRLGVAVFARRTALRAATATAGFVSLGRHHPRGGARRHGDAHPA